MKFRMTLFYFLLSISICFVSGLKTVISSQILTNSKIPSPKIEYSGKTLVNPMRLFKLDQEGTVIFKAKFYMKTKGKPDSFPLNIFNYKAIQISEGTITIYKMDQNTNTLDETTVNASLFITSIKISQIDLPCNGKYFLCGLGEFIREYKKRLDRLDFRINKEIEDTMSAKDAMAKCLVITVGSFGNLSDMPYLCFDKLEDFVFFQNFITQKVLDSAGQVYEGSIRLVNTVKVSF